MIITKLIGGLGNQMFQYATGRLVAYINNTELKLDASWFRNHEDAIERDYLLNVFKIKETFATPNEIQKIIKQSNNFFFKHFPRLISKIIPYYRQSYIKQRYFHFDPNILKVHNNTYLQGHWISEKYFKNIENIIRKDFTFKDKPNRVNQQILSQIKNCNSISIHIRRNDYVSDKKTKKHLSICGLNYYIKAISLVTKQTKNPHFFIYSDDPDWCKTHLRPKYPTTYVTHNLGKKDTEDLRLMSMCKHNIIANSTFSWWGAWLNENKNKIVIAPKKWFREKSIDTKDLIPKSWITI